MTIEIPAADILLIHGVHPSFDRNSASPWYVPVEAYKNSDFKYIAWGDTHDFQKMGNHEYYAGSLDYVSTSAMQEHTAKGYVILDTTTWNIEHVRTHARPHISIETECAVHADDELRNAPEGAVVRIRSTNPSLFMLKEYRSKFLNLAFDIRVEEKELQKLATWTEFAKPYGEEVTKLGLSYMRD